MKMMSKIEEMYENLPKIDCGCCGAPTCMAFAEDVVKKETTPDECTVIMRKLFHKYLENGNDDSVFCELWEFGKNQNEKDSTEE
jgi:CO dehydrogenase/acetyl-CoA synthase gamma subunit (corrinoid Fe-S protein)